MIDFDNIKNGDILVIDKTISLLQYVLYVKPVFHYNKSYTIVHVSTYKPRTIIITNDKGINVAISEAEPGDCCVDKRKWFNNISKAI